MSHLSNIHVVMLIDRWFPTDSGGPGQYGSSQAHVFRIRKYLREKYPCHTELFYAANSNPFIRNLYIFYVIPQIIRYSRLHPIDIIHAHGIQSALAAKIISLVIHKPIVVTVHKTPFMERNPHSLLGKIERIIYTKIQYDALISVSQSFLTHHNHNKLLKVIPNGVNVSAFNQVKVNKNPHPTVIWVGRAHSSKGLDYLKKAISKVRKQYPDLQGRFITGGQLTGTELIKAFKRAHLFVLPSVYDSHSIALLEAWAARLPVIATRVGDVAQLVKDGENGVLVEPGNVTQLSKAIIRMLRAKVTNIRMGQAGYELVKKQYSWRKTTFATYQLYQSLLQSN